MPRSVEFRVEIGRNPCRDRSYSGAGCDVLGLGAGWVGLDRCRPALLMPAWDGVVGQDVVGHGLDDVDARAWWGGA